MITSRIFKELNNTEIQRIIEDLYGSNSRITECRLLKGGLFNTTYHVKTDTDNNGIVLRVAPINQQLLFDFEQSMMAAEPRFYQLLQEKGVPSSKVLHHDGSFNIIEREFIVYEFIDSVPLNDPGVPEEVKPFLDRRVGEVMALMHDIQFERFGWERPGDPTDLFDSWGAFLQRFAREIAERAGNYGAFNDEALKRFIKVFDQAALFNSIRQARMVHTDLWEGNVLVAQHNGQWDVAAIIDVDKAIFGDKDMEFSSDWTTSDDFLSGYNQKLDDAEAAVFRRKAYQLLWSFFYAYVWLVQLESPRRFEASKRHGLRLLDSL